MTIKKVAIQMDPIEKIDLDFDTSFLLAKEAQDRGYEIFYYNPKDLEYKNRSIFALGHFFQEQIVFLLLDTHMEINIQLL